MVNRWTTKDQCAYNVISIYSGTESFLNELLLLCTTISQSLEEPLPYCSYTNAKNRTISKNGVNVCTFVLSFLLSVNTLRKHKNTSIKSRQGSSKTENCSFCSMYCKNKNVNFFAEL